MNDHQLAETAGRTYGYFKSYINDRLELVKLDAVEHSSKIISGMVTALCIGMIAMICLLFLSITLALFLGQLMGSYALAFLIVSVVYIIIGVVIFFFKRSLITIPVLTAIIRKSYE